MTAYYNENDPHAAAWLRELIKAGHIAHGEVDTRSVEDVLPSDLLPFQQAHFFAGIGGWSLALRLAGVADTERIWTGSCPCQPFSAAGKGAGFADERHLWPAFFWLIDQCRPSIVFGEQVASKDGRAWLSTVRADLETLEYRLGAADLCAAGIGAPHIRQRLYWVAHHHSERLERVGLHVQPGQPRQHQFEVGRSGEAGLLAHGGGGGARLEIEREQQTRGQQPATERGCTVGELGDACGGGSGRDAGALFGTEGSLERRLRGQPDESFPAGWAGELGDAAQYGNRAFDREPRPSDRQEIPAGRSSLWRDCDWLPCRDGKARPVEPGTFPLAHGVPGRVGLLRGYGNAIVPQLAATFAEAALDSLDII